MKNLLITLALFTLVACASAPPVPQSFDERVGAVEVGVTGIEKAATSALLDNEITQSDAKHIQQLCRSAKLLIDAARDEGNTETGQGMLSKAAALLAQLQSYEEVKK